jgi:hypothetical protein
MRCSAAVGCAARLGGGLTASGCARWLGGLGLTATFVVGLALVKVERCRQQLEESVANYLAQLDTADLQEPSEALAAKTAHLKEKLAKLASEMQKLEAYKKQKLASPDQQISLTDPDCRSMATSGRGSGVVGYNVQVAVDTEHHLFIAHDVTNSGSDRANLQTWVARPRRYSASPVKL